ncbi:glycosyltransferase family 2 protein [Bacillus licheniformis]|uniref:Glycosyltransferase family 2 protein n=4 Tax=Bacillus licheniformis TaxID=1402 RepID=A0A8B5YH82_BACLI|nr:MULTISPECIES: glycosyltransferase family 2 protein [Bacillus]HCL0418491.1 glycosyltransferase family 2 protein [Salmonella enterica subsp. enterica serovar Typhi]AKQ75080.1 hypothetical protein MUY_003948 [Bacillus licheniformis WX-02]AOP17039.1 hypothetical protein BL1202_04119 [Bacillus licheniformis]ARC60635.1 hypothetical protein BaDB11_01995 [Bacillus licheniformis]ARC63684.1 hypothetical protein B14_00657 [Bacillus licheniformis]
MDKSYSQDKRTIVSFTMVKNEADIIEVFVRYNLKFLDHMFISINRPNDETRTILKNLLKEGLPLTLWEDDDPSFEQNKKTTEAYHKISKELNFDAIVFLDADEFIYGDISEIKENIKPGNVYQMDRLEYVYLEDVSFNENVLEKIKYRRKKYQSAKSLICQDQKDYTNYKIGNGNHYVYYKGKQKIDGKLNLKLAHFPYRSTNQFTNKNILNWLSLMFNNPALLHAENTIGVHWRNSYKYLLDRNLKLSSDDLFSYLYKTTDKESFKEELVFEPLNTKDIHLRYTILENEKSLQYMLVKDFESALNKIEEMKNTQTNALTNSAQASKYDSGFIYSEIKLLNNAKVYAQDTLPRIRKIGNEVELSGAIKGISKGKSGEYIEFPKEMAPDRNFQYTNVSSHGSLAYWQVQPNGRLKLLRVTNQNADDLSWYPFHIRWFV